VSGYEVLIPTTRHAVKVMSITAEAPNIRSVVCLNETYQALPISAGYEQFVRRPTGIIEKLLGPSAYRVDVSAPITQGDSWQLGLALAHILKYNDELVDHGGGTLIWASGEVDSQLRVNSVDHIAAKIEASREILQSAKENGQRVIFLIAKENLSDLPSGIISGMTVFGVSSLAESCEAIGTKMPKQLTFPQASATPAKRGNGKALAVLGSLVGLVGLLVFNVPFQSLNNSYQYEQAGQLRMLRMEMRDIRRQKNWVATNALYFFEVMYLSAKSKKLANAITIKMNADADANEQSGCRDFNGQVINAGRLPSLSDKGCKVTFEVTSHADNKIRIWLAAIDRTSANTALQLLKNGAEIAPGQQFFTPAVAIKSANFDLIAAISERDDAVWRSWFDNLVAADSIEIANLEMDRLTSTGVGIFQARWRPYNELD
jgi:hypothetical protein